MSTIKQLKEYLSQFPDDMETDIDIVKLEPWRLELLQYIEKTEYNQTLQKMENNINKKYLINAHHVIKHYNFVMKNYVLLKILNLSINKLI